ncbi:GNAT family N-acetyltransferase [Streptomyces sp. NP-1717]|uniref:GNAT family N-acetyltransferase n=1 Tax=unclassified Streptomyces TaxID=2593676 RepID=UPI001F5DAB2F|nr:GNAT family N-acetyltransferase [Streptomyces sp. NP-1717]MCI3226171.1 GNAT family N-acetyltransferase [Streptomyces sp. NP-1717]WTA73790.1 GNAT family N-acetyltransferase [Streptomyces sp. NBC_00838]
MFRLETEVDNERRALLHERMRETNTARSAVLRELRGSADDEEFPLHVWLTEESTGALAGGLAAHVWARWLHVDLLWIDETHRGTGLGTGLLTEAEDLARARGCTHARLETWDFQAPAFYRRQGYDLAGHIPDYPPGVTEFLFTKRLT